MKKKKAPWLILIAIVLGIIVGSLTTTQTSVFGVTLYSIYDLFGQLFINSLTMVVVPLVASSIITGISRIGNEGDFGRMGLKTFAFYLGTSLMAILIGLAFVNWIEPGVSSSTVASNLRATAASAVQDHLATQEGHKIGDVILQIVPSNAFFAFSHGQMLGVIFFSLLFGYALSKVPEGQTSALKGFWQGLFHVMLYITHMIMKLLPIGVFFLVAKVFTTSGLSSLKELGMFVVTVVLGLAVFMFIGLPLLLKYIANVKPSWHFKAMAPALLTAFTTSSSSATLPITMECVEKRAGVSNRICSLVIPLGTSINMSGSALYECVGAIFVAQVYGIEMSFMTQFLVVFLALVTSIGVAGIPSASLVAILVILKAIGLPAEGIGLFIAVDRLLDMCRTTVNVFSDSCCAVLVARTEGEKKVLVTNQWEE